MADLSEAYIKQPVKESLYGKRQIYAAIASALQAARNCEKSPDHADWLANHKARWLANHKARLDWLVREYMPSGSGFDSGTQLDLVRSRPDRLVFTTAFHHMDDSGGYDGWTEHTIAIVPAFDGVSIASISGRDRNGIKDYIADLFT